MVKLRGGKNEMIFSELPHAQTPAADPFWKFLRSQKGGLLTSDVKWNFTKFTVDRKGQVRGAWE